MALQSRVIFRAAHAAGLLRWRVKDRKTHLQTDRIVAPHQLLQLFLRHVQLFAGFKVDGVDDAVGVDVLPVYMGADQHLAAVEVFCQPPRGFVGLPRIDSRAFWKALHHVVEHHAAVFVVQQLRTQKLVERRFWLTADAADELLSIPERLAELGNVAHDTFHTPARLCPLFVIHEMDDCDLTAPPSCISRRAVLIFANSCAAESRLANCTLPMFASTVS